MIAELDKPHRFPAVWFALEWTSPFPATRRS